MIDALHCHGSCAPNHSPVLSRNPMHAARVLAPLPCVGHPEPRHRRSNASHIITRVRLVVVNAFQPRPSHQRFPFFFFRPPLPLPLPLLLPLHLALVASPSVPGRRLRARLSFANSSPRLTSPSSAANAARSRRSASIRARLAAAAASSAAALAARRSSIFKDSWHLRHRIGHFRAPTDNRNWAHGMWPNWKATWSTE